MKRENKKKEITIEISLYEYEERKKKKRDMTHIYDSIIQVMETGI